MILYLVRHGEALNKSESPEQELSDDGRRDVEKVAAFLARSRIEVDVIYHSGKARARQTAEILATAIHSKNGLIQKDGLNPNDNVVPIAKAITDMHTRNMERDVMLVGHLPFMGLMTSQLLTNGPDGGSADFEAGTVLCLELDHTDTWLVKWMVIPDLITGG